MFPFALKQVGNSEIFSIKVFKNVQTQFNRKTLKYKPSNIELSLALSGHIYNVA